MSSVLGVSVKSTIFAGVPLGLLISHGVWTSEGDLVFISQVYILLRLIELSVHFVHGEISLPFLILSPFDIGVTPLVLFSFERVFCSRI